MQFLGQQIVINNNPTRKQRNPMNKNNYFFNLKFQQHLKKLSNSLLASI